MTTTIDRLAGSPEQSYVRSDELPRYRLRTRVLHWSAAAFFVGALLSGFGIYSPWLFRGIAPLFAGGAAMRVLHPWLGLGFVLVFAGQVLNWRHVMAWTPYDTRWLRRLGRYITNADKHEPEYVGFFNAGQKLYFWTIVASSFVFLVSGLPLWFPRSFGRAAAAAGYITHDLAALVMLVGFVVHVYEATAAVPGTFGAMIRGTVKKRWALSQHPAWYRRATRRYSREDYQRARARRSWRDA